MSRSAFWTPPKGTLDVVIAGFGGQGILLAGRLLANAAMRVGLNVLVYNYYEGFVRGGISECTVVFSSDVIDSPVRRRPVVVAALDERACKNWSPRVRPQGLLIVNRHLTDETCAVDGVRRLDIPATEMAAAAGNPMSVSLVVAGALAALVEALTLEDCLTVLGETVPAHRRASLGTNEAALTKGFDFVANMPPERFEQGVAPRRAGEQHGAS